MKISRKQIRKIIREQMMGPAKVPYRQPSPHVLPEDDFDSCLECGVPLTDEDDFGGYCALHASKDFADDGAIGTCSNCGCLLSYDNECGGLCCACAVAEDGVVSESRLRKSIRKLVSEVKGAPAVKWGKAEENLVQKTMKMNMPRDKEYQHGKKVAAGIDDWRKASKIANCAENENCHQFAKAFFERADELFEKM